MKKYLVAFGLSLIFFIVQVATLSSYGMNWDSPIRFLRGQAYVQFFLTGKGDFGIKRKLAPTIFHDGERVSRFDPSIGEGDKKLVTLPGHPLFLQEFQNLQKQNGSNLSFYEDDYYNLEYFLKNDGGHPPFPDIVAALSNRIFYQALHILGDVESYQMVDCLFGAIGVFLVFIFAFEILAYIGFRGLSCTLGASIAALALGLYPLFFGDSHFNMKEPLVASMYLGAVWAFWRWFMTNKNRWGVLFFVFLAISLATKWNVILLPLVLMPWLVTQIRSQEFKKWFRFKKLALFFTLGIFSSILFVIIVWPFAWSDPIGKLVQTVYYYKDLAFQATGNIQPPGFVWLYGFNLYPSFLAVISTPEIVLLLSFFGLIISFFRSHKSRSVGILLLLWLIVPVAKMTWPDILFYNGMRQEIEVIPVLAIASGIAIAWIIRNLELRIKPNTLRKFLIGGLLLSVFFLLLYPVIHLFPNENLYANSVVGGVRGSFKNNLVSQKKNYGNVYKQAADWLNIHAEKNANLALLTGNEFALSPTFLRHDISISPYNFSGFAQKGEYVIEVYDPSNPQYFAYQYLFRFLQPVYTLRVDGTALLKIFHNIPQKIKPDMRREQTITNPLVRMHQTPLGKQVAINIGVPVRITKIVVDNVPKNCQKISYNYGEETVGFYLEQGIRDSFYIFTDKTLLGNNRIMYSFAAIPGQVISIDASNNSCFATGNIASVSFLP